ncbi:MAG: thioredoxin domain-containing protein [Gemmatimonadota bacterium]
MPRYFSKASLARVPAVALVLSLAMAGCGETSEAAPGGGSSDAVASANVSAGSQAGVPGQPGPQAVDLSTLGYDMGTVMAPIRVIEFSDFGCIYCKLFQEESFPALREEFVDAGHVAWKFIPFNLGTFTNSGQVALAAECALEQDALEDLKGSLFRTQDQWKSSTPEEARALVDGLARDAGLDTGRFQRCLEQGLRDDRHEASNQAARAIGVRGTPTFIVDGQLVQGAPPLEMFQEYFRERVAELGTEGEG